VAGRAVGVFHLESAPDGGEVRWTGPLAAIKVNVPGGGTARARIELLPMERPEGAPAAAPRVGVDNRMVPAQVSEDAIEFEVGGGEHWISIACRPFRPRRHGVDDSRALGLPLRGISFEAR
jgi:hypothetical protein